MEIYMSDNVRAIQ